MKTKIQVIAQLLSFIAGVCGFYTFISSFWNEKGNHELNEAKLCALLCSVVLFLLAIWLIQIAKSLRTD